MTKCIIILLLFLSSCKTSKVSLLERYAVAVTNNSSLDNEKLLSEDAIKAWNGINSDIISEKTCRLLGENISKTNPVGSSLPSTEK